MVSGLRLPAYHFNSPQQVDEHLVALAEWQRAFFDLLARALEGDREVVEREPFGALEVKGALRLGLQRVQHARALPGELGGDARVDLYEERLRVGVLDGDVAELALERDRDRFLRADHALALAGGTGARHDLAHPLGDVLACHLD